MDMLLQNNQEIHVKRQQYKTQSSHDSEDVNVALLGSNIVWIWRKDTNTLEEHTASVL